MAPKRRKVFIAVLIAIVFMAIIPTIFGYNIIVPSSKMVNDMLNYRLPTAKPGDTLQLFKNYDFTHGKWAGYLVISADDRAGVHPKLAGRTCWKTTDLTVLKEMQRRWKFKINKDADMATVTSSFYLVRDGVVVFDAGIVADSNSQGLQMQKYGWMQPIDAGAIVDVLGKFNKVWWPIVFI